MAENTTSAGPRVVGEPQHHPAVRRLARACIALVRWQRNTARPAAKGAAAADIAEPRHD